MAFSRRLGIIGLVGASWLVAVACNDDGDRKATKASDGGDGGKAPSGGKATGGSANNAGKAGTATAGTAGTTTGGDAGATSGGNGGMSGGGTTPVGGENPGGAGGAAGAGGSAAGAGGDGGAGGAGGVAAAAAQSCGNVCASDEDCAITGVLGQKCNTSSHRCYDSNVVTCQTSDDCAPSASAWSVICTSDAQCADDNTESCVASGGVGYCALLSVGDACDFGEPKDLPRVGAAGVSNVCVGSDRCQSGVCSFNCADPLFGGFCGAGNGDSCNASSGLCECTTGAECNTGVCGADKQCAQCATDQDCLDLGALSGYDVCVSGRCGCSEASVCPDQTASGTPVCE